MQKVINILVSIVFLISFIGVNIHKHYSHGKLYSTAIFQEAESCCVNMEHCEMTNTHKSCENQQEDDCSCEDKTETIKISDVFINERYSFTNTNVLALFPVSLFQFEETIVSPASFNKIKINLSPPLVETDILAKFSTFLI